MPAFQRPNQIDPVGEVFCEDPQLDMIERLASEEGVQFSELFT